MSEKNDFVPTISLENLIDIVGDEPEVLRDIIASFLDESPRCLQSVQAGLQTQDAALVERDAHTLKSNSRLFQAENFALQCQDLEHYAQREDWEAIATEVPKLVHNFQLLAEILMAELEKF